MKEFKEENKNYIWMVVSFLLAIATIWMVINKSGNMSIEVLFDTIVSANKGWLFLSIVASTLYVGMEGLALRLLLKCAGYKKSRMKTLIYSTSDIYFSAITPSASGGQPASAFFMLRDGVPGGVAAACLVVNLIMYTFAIIVLGIIALFVDPSLGISFGKSSKVFIYLGFAALTLLAAFFVAIMLMGEKMFDFIKKIILKLEKKRIVKGKNRITERLEKTKNDYKACTELIFGNPQMMIRVFFCDLFQRAAQIVVPMLIYLSLGGNYKNASGMFSKQCIITVGYNFVPVPGAMGISDYLMIEGYSKIMSSDMAYKIEMIGRGITFTEDGIKESDSHGIGLKNISSLMEKMGGKMGTEIVDNSFRLILTFQYSG